jgi:hypothetical protein
MDDASPDNLQRRLRVSGNKKISKRNQFAEEVFYNNEVSKYRCCTDNRAYEEQ